MESNIRKMEQDLRVMSTAAQAKPFSICRRLVTATDKLISRNDCKQFGQWMRKVLQYYTASRSAIVRTAIENVLIYGLSSRILRSPMRNEFMSFMPDTFRAILKNQIISSGI